MQTKVSYIQDKYGIWSLVIERENSKQGILLNEVEAEEVIATLSRHLTKRAPDAALPPKCQRCIAGDQPLSDCCLAPESPRR